MYTGLGQYTPGTVVMDSWPVYGIFPAHQFSFSVLFIVDFLFGFLLQTKVIRTSAIQLQCKKKILRGMYCGFIVVVLHLSVFKRTLNFCHSTVSSRILSGGYGQ